MKERSTCLIHAAKIQHFWDICKHRSGNLLQIPRKIANPAPNPAQHKRLLLSELTYVCGSLGNFFMQITLNARACARTLLYEDNQSLALKQNDYPQSFHQRPTGARRTQPKAAPWVDDRLDIRPAREKAFIFNAFSLAGRRSYYIIYPGRCPGL